MMRDHPATIITALLAMLLASAGVAADVFKCTNEKGLTTYQDIPCKAGHSEQRIDLSATSSSAEQSEAIRAAAEALRKQDRELADRLQRDSESRRELAARTPAPTYSHPQSIDNDYSRDSGYAWVPYQQTTGTWRAGVYYPPYYRSPNYPPGNQIGQNNGYRRHVYGDFRDSPYYNSVAGYPLPQANRGMDHQPASAVGPRTTRRPSTALGSITIEE